MTNNWQSCGACADDDGDGFHAGCDAYATIPGPDCDGANPSCTTDCTTDVDSDTTVDCADTCLDADGDGYGSAGGAGNTCTAADCDDTVATLRGFAAIADRSTYPNESE